MGHRMELYVPEARAKEIIAISDSFDIEARMVGRVEAASTKEVVLKSEYGEFSYT